MDTLATTEREGPNLIAELFDAAQLAHAGAASQAVLHKARQQRDEAGRELIQKRAALIAEKCALDRQLLHSMSGVFRGTDINPTAAKARVAKLGQEIARIDDAMAPVAENSAPAFSTQTVEQVMQHLKVGESMLVQVTGTGGTHLFWIDAVGVSYRTTPLTTEALSQHVNHLRTSINIATVKPDAALPAVPLRSAYTLYAGLFEPFADRMAATKTIFFAADGAARSIPVSMLLTRDYGEVALADLHALADLDWLGAAHAVSVIPSPAAWVALRQQRDRPVGEVSFVGIGNPTFARARYALPETETELRRLAEVFGGFQPPQVILGLDANEAAVRTSEDIREARILAFATHGLLNRELGVTEPALMLASHPDHAQTDDGFLTASEIATFELKADWVILSACNTAAGRDDRAEGLSGLARSFFQAGARSLLVSHWYVPSSAAGALTVFTAEALAHSSDIGRAEALKMAMARVREGATLDGSVNPRFGHPAYWAPFVIVGEVT